MRNRMRRRIAIAAVVSLFVSTAAFADELRVMTSGAFTDVCRQLAPVFEQQTGHTITLIFGASMGAGADTIPSRLDRHEAADIVVLAGSALDDLIARRQVASDSRRDLVRSRIGMAVRHGAPKPDISTVSKLRDVLVAARSIGYSSSASGVYLSTELFPRLGLAEALKGKLKVSQGAVGTLIADGEVDIGFQQISELLPVQGIDYVGPLPEGAQRETIFSAAIVAWAGHPEAARALLDFFQAPANVELIRKAGLEPVK